MVLASGIFNYLKFSILLISIVVSSAVGMAAVAADNNGVMLHLADPNERLSKPDLSALTRFRILTTADFPPFNFVDQTGRLAGFHVDLAREICHELAIEQKCQIQAVPFAELQPMLDAGNGEVALAGIAVTADLRKKFLFSNPYLMMPARFIASRKAGLSGSAATALADKPVGVVENTAHQKMLAAFFPKIRAVAFASQEDMLTALKENKVEAVFGDALRLPFWAASPAAEKCCQLFDGPYLSEHYLGEGFAAMIRPAGSAQIKQAVDYALTQLSQKGRIQDIYLRYFPNGFY